MRKIIICTCNTSTKHKMQEFRNQIGRKYSIETVLSANYLLQPLVF